MPLKTEKRNGKWRAVEANTGRLARRNDGSLVDKGGFKTKAPVIRRMTPINISYARKRGTKIPKRK